MRDPPGLGLGEHGLVLAEVSWVTGPVFVAVVERLLVRVVLTLSRGDAKRDQ